MTISEASIGIDEAAEGMVLSQDLRDGGAILLPAGASLTRASLASLARRGIERLHVVADAEAAAPDPAAVRAAREQQCARLAQLFRRSAGSGATDLLIARLLHYRKEG